MTEQMHELKAVLQTLGLPVTGQVRLVKDDCTRIAILTGAFASARRTVRAEASGALTPKQAALLAELDRRLRDVCRQASGPLCSEMDLRQSAGWRQVRGTARKALLQFGWTLELPPREGLASSTYRVGGKGRRWRDDSI